MDTLNVCVGTTSVRFAVNRGGILPAGPGVNAGAFIKANLIEYEYSHRFAKYLPVYKFAVYDEDTGTVSIPRYSLNKFLEFLERYRVPYTLVHMPPIEPRNIKLKLKKKFAPRGPQDELIAFMKSDNPYKPVSAQMGLGKTFCSEAAICELGHPAIVVLGLLVNQWYKSIRQHIDIPKHDIFVAQGYASLKKLWDAVTNGYKPKILIFSTRTLLSYVYRLNQYSELPTYNELCRRLGIGIKIIDEVHLGFNTNTRIDLYSNIKHNIYLSATYQRTTHEGAKIFDMVFPREMRYGDEFTKKYITVYMVRYNLGIQETALSEFRVAKGYMHALYENYLLERSKFFTDFVQRVLTRLISNYYLDVREEEHKCLILCQTKAFANAVHTALQQVFPDNKICVYFSSEHNEKIIEKHEIIISTAKSCGVGRDIKMLKTCINTISYSSEPLTNQVMGRLRHIPDTEVLFIDTFNNDVPTHRTHANNRCQIYASKAEKLFRLFI